MRVTLRVLLIEDSEDDAALVLRELRRGGYEPICQQVQTAVDLGAALDQQEWDVVISDFAMPQFSGMAALAIVRERQPDLPFILVSGNIGEEMAVSAMKAGANDYLMKNALARLAPAVRKEIAETKARRSAEAHKTAILETALDCIITMDHEGKITQFNPAAEQVFRYKRQEVIGRELAELLIPAALRDAHRRALAEYGRTGVGRVLGQRIEMNAMRADGSEFPVELAITRITLSDPPAFTAYLRDITQRKQAEEELRKAREELEARVEQRTTELAQVNRSLQLEVAERLRAEAEAQRAKAAAESASRAKSEFLANMSHEIRTPMTAILGYADRLLDPEQTVADRLNHVNTIRRNGAHLLTVINDILDVSKIEAGEMKMERVACSTSMIIGDVASTMRVRAIEKNLKFDVVLATAVPETIETDPTRFRQVIINLLGNAIKFTEAGWVRLSVRYDANGPGGANRLVVEIIDTGVGITPEQQSHIFEPFAQGDASTTRKFGGTGLGLTISRKLARMLGGDIDVDSTIGRGSTFTVSIDPGPVAADAMMISTFKEVITDVGPLRVGARLAGRVLLAEDGPDIQQLLSHYLRNAGAEVAVADNGRIAVEKILAAAAAGHPFHVVLMDMQMPELDGYGATSELRRRGQDLPIVALTAHAMAHDRAKCLNCGCTDFLSKPVSRKELIETIAKHLPASDQAESHELLVSSVADDPEILQFLPGFVGHLPEQVSRLERLLGETNLKGLEAVLHQLKGTCGLYGFPQLTEMAGRAEQSVKEEKAIEVLKREVQSLIAVIATVQGYKSVGHIPQPDAEKAG
jgi:PAS domain S-box-containing protein